MEEKKKRIPTPEEIETAYNCGIIDAETADRLKSEAEAMRRQQIIKEVHGRQLFFCSGFWITYVYDDDGKRKQIKRKKRADLEDWIIRKYGYEDKEETPPTVSEVFKEWNDSRLQAGRVKGSTHLRDKRFYDRYFRGTDFEKREIETTTAEDWAAFVQGHFDDGLTSKQWGGLRGIVHGMYKHARRAGLITWRYSDMIDLLDLHFVDTPRKDDADEILYSNELQALREFCLSHWGPHERCIWLTSYTGTRIGEVVALTPDDIDLQTMTVYIRQRETRGDSQGRPRVVIIDGAKTAAGIRKVAIPPSISDRVRDIVERARRNNWEYLFCGRNGQRLSAEAVRRRLRKIEIEELGMETVKPPHKLRKTVASILHDSGKLSDRQIEEQMGHTDIRTTEKFYVKDRVTIDQRAVLLDEIEEMGIAQK